ncbi:MAG: branched-chain amino acid ABC transporter permease, partial [Aestuariivirga sp.]
MNDLANPFAVERWTSASKVGAWGFFAVSIGLALAPILVSASALDRLTVLFIYVILASMWNALAG